MLKHKLFTGQPIFTQLLSFIPRSIVVKATRDHLGDRYCKRFKTYDHLVSMLYVGFHQCTSIREAITGMQANHMRLFHTGLTATPRRSTLSDANKRRSAQVFEQIYHRLYQYHYCSLPDSRRNLYIIDSTTITLFTNIIRGAGSFKSNGKKKGGVKAHVLLNARHDVASFVRITEGRHHDLVFLQGLVVPAGSVVVFDRAYTNYEKFQEWTNQGTHWVSRQKNDAVFKVLHTSAIANSDKKEGVIKDQKILQGRSSNKSKTPLIQVRRIVYKDDQTKKKFIFITNDFQSSPLEIASTYKRRWQIELVFKRIKQRYPLRYFLGDNENAIKIQIWTALICDLLIQIVKDTVQQKAKTRWSYANLASMVKHHLMTYIRLIPFLISPEKALLNYSPPPLQRLTLF
jgi:hypothetical protein